MEQPVPVKEVKILETAEDIQERREQVLRRYIDFKEAARVKREKLEDSRRFQYFRRDADELESWIADKLPLASSADYGTDVENVGMLTNDNRSNVEALARACCDRIVSF